MEYMYNLESHFGEFERAILISAKSIPSRALEFEVMTERGVLRDKLPIEAIVAKPDAPKKSTSDLQLWNCFSYNFIVIKKPWLNRCTVFTKDRTKEKGTCLWTFDWAADSDTYDTSTAEIPEEHKTMHFIQMDSGVFMLQPNNRVQWHEPSFITKPFPDRPDYKVASQVYDCESGDKWKTEDSDRQFYELEETE